MTKFRKLFALQSLGSRIAKRLRLRRSDCFMGRSEESEGKKHHHGHHRRHSAGPRQCGPGTFQDILSQCVQSLAKVTEPVVVTNTSDATTSTSPPDNAANANNATNATSQTEAQMHCKNAEKYAKVGIDLFSNLAQNLTTIMDPFAAAFAFDAANLNKENPMFAGAAAAAAHPATETPPAEKPQTEQQPPLQAKEPSVEKLIEVPSTSSVTTDSIAPIVLTPVVVAQPAPESSPMSLASSASSVSSTKSIASDVNQQQKVGDWTMLDVNDLAEEMAAATQTATPAPTPTVISTGAIPKKAQPDYEELSRALRSHIEEFQQIFNGKGKDDAMQSKKTQTPPATPEVSVAPQPRHPGKSSSLAISFTNISSFDLFIASQIHVYKNRCPL